MYTPSYRTQKNGVPVLKKEEIDTIGEEYVRDFQPEVLRNPAPVDIEGFIECYLGMTTDYQYLSHNGIYLGMKEDTTSSTRPFSDMIQTRCRSLAQRWLP